jgi:hypothetical protein
MGISRLEASCAPRERNPAPRQRRGEMLAPIVLETSIALASWESCQPAGLSLRTPAALNRARAR